MLANLNFTKGQTLIQDFGVLVSEDFTLTTEGGLVVSYQEVSIEVGRVSGVLA